MTNIINLISHRGNIEGPNPSTENKPEHINDIIKNFDCEIDVWMVDGRLFLGHDQPTFKIKKSFLKQKRLWCHAKNLNAFEYMLQSGIHCFFHDKDQYALTSKKYIWTFPNQETTDRSVIVDLNKNWKDKNYKCHGVCSDFLFVKNEQTKILN